LEYLVERAFDVQRFQVTGGPDWMYAEGFDIEAKPAAVPKSGVSADGAVLNDLQRQMLLTLLEDRFHFQYHCDTKLGQVYFLSTANKKLKLAETNNREAAPWVLGPETGIAGGNVSIPLLARHLSRWLGRPVIDRTSLDGAYDFRFEYDSFNLGRDAEASIPVSVQGLGLKLEPGKGAVETIVIDHAETLSGN